MNKEIIKKKMPTYKDSVGNVSITEFSNTRENKEGKEFTSKTVVLQKVYTDKKGVLKNTNTLNRTELQILSVLIIRYL